MSDNAYSDGLFLESVENKNSENSSHMSGMSAVEKILTDTGAPLHYKEITRLIIEKGYWKTEGQTPSDTINAHVAVEIKKKGKDSRFQRTEPGVFALRSWGLPEFIREEKQPKAPESLPKKPIAVKRVVSLDLARQIEQHNDMVRNKLHRKLFEISAVDFEKLIGELLVALGFEDVEVTQRSADGGIDVRGTLVVGAVIRTRMAVQVKRWKNNVQAPIVQQVRGSLGTHDQGLIVTTSSFSSGARAEAERPNAIPVALMNGEQLVRLLIENKMGIRRTEHYLIELEDIGDD